MKRDKCWPVFVVVLLISVVLFQACVSMPPPPAGAPPLSLTFTATPAPQPSPGEPSPTSATPLLTGRTHPPAITWLTPAPLAGSREEIAAKLDEFISSYAPVVKLSGVFHVELNGETVLGRAYNHAETEETQPITLQRRFRIGWLSNSMTAAAILRLQQQGGLTVQDAICKYIPDCPAAWQPVTIHHLLTHTSGMPHYPSAPGYDAWKKTPQTLDQMLAHIKKLPLSFEPGAQLEGSYSGYVVLSYIIERVSGMPFEQAMKQLVFAPLGMADTGLTEAGTDMAAGYSDRTPTANREVLTNHYGAGGFYSTAGDLARWAHAWMSEDLLPASLRDLALADHVLPAADDWFGYGIGNDLPGSKIAGRVTFGYGGWVEGFLAEWRFIPEDRTVVVILVNNDRLDTVTLWRGIENRIYQ